MENYKNDMPAFLDTEIDLYTLLHDIVVNFWVILLGALAAAILTYVVSNVRYEPRYETTATFAVMAKHHSGGYSNLSSANSMANTFQKILKSNVMEKTICEKLDVEEIDADIKTKVLEGTNLLILSVAADSPKESIDIIRTIMENYSEVMLYTVGDEVMTVLEDPVIPYSPSNFLDAKGMAKKGFLAGGAVCILLLGLMSCLRNSVKQEKEIEKKLDARSLGAISYEWKYKTVKAAVKRKKNAILVDSPLAGFRFVESYKKLAAKVDYQMEKENRKSLAVTSAAENEGKSTVAANLAITLAKQSKRVLLVDGDIRRPSQFLIFGLEPEEKNELGELLKGQGIAKDLLMKGVRQNLFFMGGRNSYSSSTEMLQSDRLPRLLNSCRKSVDYIIIDTPPAGLMGDAQVIARCADAVMLVVKQNFMLAEEVNDVLDEFRDNHTKVLGVVLNGVQTFESVADSPAGNYYGKYSKYGRYGNYDKGI